MKTPLLSLLCLLALPGAAAAYSPSDPTVVFTSYDFPGGGGVHLPSLWVTKPGTVIAVCQHRREATTDWGHDIELILRRSTNNALSWEPAHIVVGGSGWNCVNGPIVEDRQTGTLILPFTKVPSSGKVQSDWVEYMAKNGGSLWTITSRDDGQTWSAPVETKPKGKDGWIAWAGNNSHGLQLADGRLVIPGFAHHHAGSGPHAYRALEVNACLLYSDDHGQSWTIGATAPYFTDETAVVQCEDGSLLACIRINNRKPHDLVKLMARSRDRGETFASTELQDHLSWSDCHVGLNSMVDDSLGHRRHILIYSGPQGNGALTGHDRTRLTVRLSYDGGRTWPAARILTDPSRDAEYSDLAVTADGTILCLYGIDTFSHVSSQMELLRFPLSEIELDYGP